MENAQIVASHLDLLGMRVRDKVSNYEGVVESVAFDLYGCVQAVVRPPMNEKGEVPSGHYFDVTRLEVTDGKRVVDLPRFDIGYVAEGRKGAADKPVP